MKNCKIRISAILALATAALAILAAPDAFAASAASAATTVEVSLPVGTLRNAPPREEVVPEEPGKPTLVVRINGQAEPLLLPVVADTYIIRGNGDANKGKDSVLALRDNGAMSALVRVDLAALKDIAPASVSEAALSFSAPWVERPGSGVKISAHAMRTEWDEDASWSAPRKGAAWQGGANGPAAGGDYDAAAAGAFESGAVKAGAVEIAGLAETLRGWLSGKTPQNGLLLALRGGAMQVNLLARERFIKDPNAFALHPVALLGAEAVACFIPDAEVLKSVALAPDDIEGGLLRVKILRSENIQPGAEIEVFALLADAAGLNARAPAAGRDYAPQKLGGARLQDAAKDGFLEIKLAPAALRSGRGALLRLKNSDARGVVEFGSETAKGASAPTFMVSLKARENAQLFRQPLRPRAGVYAKAKEGRFDYGGERLRLWGVALTPRPNAEIAARLRKLGFNSARLWGPDTKTFYAAEVSDAALRPAGKDGDSNADQYHRMFAAMKAEGLFIDCTALMDSAPVDASDNSWLKTAAGAADAADWEAWREAYAQKNLSRVIHSFGASFDERLMAARKRHIQNFLTFTNPHTGKKYGEEECIAIYELANEQNYFMRIMENGFDDWPAYFRDKYRRQWNAWLAEKYGADDAKLAAAWGRLDAGETLAQNTVALAPVLSQRAAHSAARAADFIEFNCAAIDRYYKELEAFARTFAPPGVGVNVAPFSYDTQFRPSLQWLHTIANGDVANFGTYSWTLSSALSAPPSFYTMDSHTVKGKPTVIYETNVGRPNPQRAEMPLRLAAFGSFQDWDAVYWHFFSGITAPREVPDEQYLAQPVKYMRPNFYWTAVEFESDPALQSAISAAGDIFLRGLLAPAPAPVDYVVPRGSLFSFDTFNGVNTARAAFEHGARFDFRPAEDGKYSVENIDPDALKKRLDGAVRSGEQIIWDWPNSRLLIDAPAVKAYIGKPAGDYRFSDGISVGGFDGDFICFVLASADGKPILGNAGDLHLCAIRDAKNTGFAMDAESLYRPNGTHTAPDAQARAITNHGSLPVSYDPVSAELRWPRAWTGSAAAYDFAFRKTREIPLAGNRLDISALARDGVPAWHAPLRVASTGAPSPTPPTTQPIALPDDAPAIAAAPGALPPPRAAAGAWLPLPFICWTDDYYRAHQLLRDGGLNMSRISPEDTAKTPRKTLTLSDLELPDSTSANVDITFDNERMARIELAYVRPLALSDQLAVLEKELGAPAQKTIAPSADKVSVITWSLHAYGLEVELKETQGIQTLTATKKP